MRILAIAPIVFVLQVEQMLSGIASAIQTCLLAQNRDEITQTQDAAGNHLQISVLTEHSTERDLPCSQMHLLPQELHGLLFLGQWVSLCTGSDLAKVQDLCDLDLNCLRPHQSLRTQMHMNPANDAATAGSAVCPAKITECSMPTSL